MSKPKEKTRAKRPKTCPASFTRTSSKSPSAQTSSTTSSRKRARKRAKARARAANAPQPLLKKRGRPEKRVRIGEALRTQGLDEHTVAGNYVQMAEKLAKDGAKVTAADKLLFDLQKECTRQLEAATEAEQKAERAGSRDVPVIVHLVHNVPRPARPERAAVIADVPDALATADAATEN